MCQNRVNKNFVNRTKQQIKLLVESIDVNNNSDVYQSLQYLLSQLKVQNQSKLKAYDSNIMFSSAKDYQQYQRDKFWKEKAQQNKELLEKTGLWIYSPAYYELAQKHPKVAKWYKDLFENMKDCKVKLSSQAIQDIDSYLNMSGQIETINLLKQQYAYMKFNEKYPYISSAYFMRKVKVHRLQSKQQIDQHIEFIAKQLISKQLDIYILAEQIGAIMNDIGDSYTQIQPDGTILIMNSNFQPLIKVYNRKNAQHYVAPIKVYYKGDFNDQNNKRHIAIV